MNNPAILVLEKDTAQCQALCDTLELAGFRATAAESGSNALTLMADHQFDLVVSDVQLDRVDDTALLQTLRSRYPRVPVLLVTAYGSIDKAVSAMRDGAVDYLVKPFDDGALVSLVRRHLTRRIRDGVATADSSVRLLKMADRAANSEAAVLITGDNTLSRENLARYIHEHSPRWDGPYVTVNCTDLLEDELRRTLFESIWQAHGGTLFLDEISGLDQDLQRRLLRVLQQRQLTRSATETEHPLDIRVLAADSGELRRLVEEGGFRMDLYYRLNVFPLRISSHEMFAVAQTGNWFPVGRAGAGIN